MGIGLLRLGGDRAEPFAGFTIVSLLFGPNIMLLSLFGITNLWPQLERAHLTEINILP